MANGQTNYGGNRGGYINPYGGFGHLVAGARAMRNMTGPPNFLMQYQLGQSAAQQASQTRLMEKRLMLMDQEKMAMDALNNEAWTPDTNEMSDWARQLTTDNLIDWKKQYLSATSLGLGKNVSVKDRAESARLQKKIQDATVQMGGDLLAIDNLSQFYMEDRGNLSWSGKREEFTKYIHPNAVKRVDKETGKVYITPVDKNGKVDYTGESGEEISVKDFKEMYPTAIPHKAFETKIKSLEIERKNYWSGLYGLDDKSTTGINEGGSKGLLQKLKSNLFKTINSARADDDELDLQSAVLSFIEDDDPAHGEKFKEGDNGRYDYLQNMWRTQISPSGDWINGSEQDMYRLRLAVNNDENQETKFKSLQDEYVNFEAQAEYDWITGQKAPTPDMTHAQKIQQDKIKADLYKAKNKRLELLINKGDEEALQAFTKDWVLEMIGGTKNKNGKVIDNTVGSASDSPLTQELLENFKIHLPENATDFEFLNTTDLLNNIQGVGGKGQVVDVNIISGNAKIHWNDVIGAEGTLGNHVLAPGDQVIFTTSSSVASTETTGKYPEREIIATQYGEVEEDMNTYTARVMEHIKNEKIAKTSQKVTTKEHAPITYNGSLNDLVQSLAQGIVGEDVDLVETDLMAANKLRNKLKLLKKIEEN